MNFKDYFFKDKTDLTSMGTGKEHHKTVGRLMKMGDRKSLNFIAKSQSQPKRAEHPKIDLCLRTKKDTPLTTNDAFEIMDDKNTHPTPNEKLKRFKKLPIGIELIKPQVYILRYLQDEENKWKL